MSPKVLPMERCPWCEGFEIYREYHDNEWAVPLFDDSALFELLILEGAQAGLSWATVLKKRGHYRQVFDGFKPDPTHNRTHPVASGYLSWQGLRRYLLPMR